jgi:hypothetical protein
MRQRIWLILCATLVLVGLGCNLPALFETSPTPAGKLRPTFVNIPAPVFSTNLKPFQDAGCKPDPQGKLRCPPNLAPFNRFGCVEIVQAPALLGGLKGGVPLMKCLLEAQPEKSLDPGEYFYDQGCLVPSYVRYLVYQDNQIVLLKNLADLKARFAPPATPEQALSYALAATGFQALYGLKDENMRYLKPQIEDTQVQAENGGYRLRLYSFGTCGCGPHAMRLRTVHIDAQGNLAVDDPQPVWEDPTLDEVCVD